VETKRVTVEGVRAKGGKNGLRESLCDFMDSTRGKACCKTTCVRAGGWVGGRLYARVFPTPYTRVRECNTGHQQEADRPPFEMVTYS
jgi:hypothetical protein